MFNTIYIVCVKHTYDDGDEADVYEDRDEDDDDNDDDDDFSDSDDNDNDEDSSFSWHHYFPRHDRHHYRRSISINQLILQLYTLYST
jgi:hypothetical protein